MKNTWSNLFVFAPAKIELSFNHWGDDRITILDFDIQSSGDEIQVISGLNGSGKTITLEAIKKFTDVFSKPSTETLRSFQKFASNVQLNYIMVEFKSTKPIVYDELHDNGNFKIDIDNLPYGYSINGEFTGSDYSLIDGEKFSNYFGWDLDTDKWLAFKTTLSKCVKFENKKNPKWYIKQKGRVDVTHNGNSGDFDWDEGWKSVDKVHERGEVNREFLLHVNNISPDTNAWKDKFGIDFEQQWYDLDDATTAPGCISIARGSSYIEVKNAYTIDQSFLEELTKRINQIRELRSSISSYDYDSFERVYNQIKEGLSSNYHFSAIESLLNRIKSKIGLKFQDNERVKEMNIQEFIHYLSSYSPETYILFLIDELSYISLVLAFLCDGAEFIDTDLRHLTAGQKRVINLAHQWYEAPQGELILIDEPEVSLHISWQRNMISAFNDINSHISDVLRQTRSDDEFLESMKKSGESHYDIIPLVLERYSNLLSKRMLIATHSPDIIYHHQNLVSHIPPLGGD